MKHRVVLDTRNSKINSTVFNPRSAPLCVMCMYLDALSLNCTPATQVAPYVCSATWDRGYWCACNQSFSGDGTVCTGNQYARG